MFWIEMEQPEGKKLPKWVRSCGISNDGMTVFVPAAIAGNEEEVMLCTLYDSTPSISYLKHTYVPSSWLAVEYPKTQELVELMEFKVKEYFNKEKVNKRAL